jgi:hypothetical protein
MVGNSNGQNQNQNHEDDQNLHIHTILVQGVVRLYGTIDFVPVSHDHDQQRLYVGTVEPLYQEVPCVHVFAVEIGNVNVRDKLNRLVENVKPVDVEHNNNLSMIGWHTSMKNQLKAVMYVYPQRTV